ncbi:MAG TPA: ABC transporter permease [Candidatus Krumholzibacteria bacterium]|nr:ABC transporter permease [Candidatus Krumholzibacteria bacterium]
MLNRAQVAYLIGESFAGFRRRKLTTGVTILIMGSALLALAVLTLATLNLGQMLEQARSGIDLRVFLAEGLSVTDQATLQPRLVAIPGVQAATYISPEAALDEFRAGLGDDAQMLDLLESNPLPPSFHLTLAPESRTLQAVQAAAGEIGSWPEVDEVVYHQDWIDALEAWTFRFQLASLLVGLVVFVAAVFVISNTVKLTMAASARVIQVQKLVGATNAFIRTPYLCEGMIQGLLAGALAMAVLVGAGWFLDDRLGSIVFFSPMQIGGFVAFCVSLGLVGSWSAMRKYLTLRSEI